MPGKEIRGRSARANYRHGGRTGFKQGGAYGPLRGTTAGGVAKAFRGKAGFKESQALQKKLTGSARKTGNIKNKKGEVIGSRIAKAGSLKAMGIPRARFKSEAKFQNFKKNINKTPNKVFKSENISGKAQKKKIIQEQTMKKRKYEVTGDKWRPLDYGAKAKGGRV